MKYDVSRHNAEREIRLPDAEIAERYLSGATTAELAHMGPDAGGKMTTKPTYGSQPKPLGKFASVTEAARKLGVTRQEAKRILRGGK